MNNNFKFYEGYVKICALDKDHKPLTTGAGVIMDHGDKAGRLAALNTVNYYYDKDGGARTIPISKEEAMDAVGLLRSTELEHEFKGVVELTAFDAQGNSVESFTGDNTARENIVKIRRFVHTNLRAGHYIDAIVQQQV